MDIDRAALDRYITGNYGEDQFSEEADPTESLFERWPRPWSYDDNRDGHVGYTATFDARGELILLTGDMESCGMAEIRLAQAVAALPVLLELAQAVAADYEDAADWKDARGRLLGLAQAALAELA